jgi:phage FluMu protein Com
MPDNLSAELKQKCSVLKKKGKVMEAIVLLKTKTGIELGDAKAIGYHVSNGIKCHRCKKELEQKGQVLCSKCKSLNFVW